MLVKPLDNSRREVYKCAFIHHTMISAEEYKTKYEEKENRINAFNEFCKLKNEGATKRKLVLNINRKYCINAGTIYSWTYRNNSPYIVRVKVCPELFYVIGAILGDGCIYQWRHIYRINLVGDEAFTRKYANKLSVCLNRPVKNYFKRNRNYWFVNRTNVELFFMIKTIRTNLDSLLELFKQGNTKENCLQFLEGFFDAEGCVKIIKEPTIRKTPKVCLDIYNTNYAFLELCRNILSEYLNITTRYSVQNPSDKDEYERKVAYHLRIYKKEYVKIFLENIDTTKLKKEKINYVKTWLELK